MGYPHANENPSPNLGSYNPVTVADVKEALGAAKPASELLQFVYDDRLAYSVASWWWKHYHGKDANLQDAAEREERA